MRLLIAAVLMAAFPAFADDPIPGPDGLVRVPWTALKRTVDDNRDLRQEVLRLRKQLAEGKCS